MGKKGDPRPQSSGGSTGSSGARCSTMWCEPNSAVGMILGRRLRSPTFARGSCTPRAVRRPKGPLSHGRCRNPWWSIAPGHGDGAHSQPRQRGNDASLSSCPRGNIRCPLPQGPGRIDTTYLTRGEGQDGSSPLVPAPETDPTVAGRRSRAGSGGRSPVTIRNWSAPSTVTKAIAALACGPWNAPASSSLADPPGRRQHPYPSR
jgi:hypothetical protein